jgi:hypothetical protein
VAGLLFVACALWWGRPAFFSHSGPGVADSAHASMLTTSAHPVPEVVSTARPAVEKGPAKPATEQLATPGKESDLDKLIVGSWEQINHGKRFLEVLQDGTATMNVNLEGAWALVVGEKLEFQIEWTIEKERLLFKMTGGKPEGSLKLISSLYGDERNHRIESLTDEQMILIDEKDNSRDTWKRVASAKK